MDNMDIFELQPFVKYVVLKIDLIFETEIIDEANFAITDIFAIKKFEQNYIYRDDCVVVEIDM